MVEFKPYEQYYAFIFTFVFMICIVTNVGAATLFPGAEDMDTQKISLNIGTTISEKNIIDISSGDLTLTDKASGLYVKSTTNINDVSFKPSITTADKGEVTLSTSDRDPSATFIYSATENQIKEIIILKEDTKLSFTIEVDEKSKLIPWYNGEYKIVSTDGFDTMTGIVAAKPFGIDADGKYIDMNYKLEKGNILNLIYNRTISVLTPKSFVSNGEPIESIVEIPIKYPLTIDPTWTFVGGCYTYTSGNWTYYMWNTAGNSQFTLSDVDRVEVILAGGGGGGGSGGGNTQVATYSCTLACSCTLSGVNTALETGVGGLPAVEGTSGNYSMAVTPFSVVNVSVGAGGGGGSAGPWVLGFIVTGAGHGTCYPGTRYIDTYGGTGSTSLFSSFNTLGGPGGRFTASHTEGDAAWGNLVYNNTAYGDDGFYIADGVTAATGVSSNGGGYAGGYGYGAGGGGGGYGNYGSFGGVGGIGAKGYLEIRYLTPVPQAPIANFTATPTSVVTGQNVQFTDTSTKLPTSWAWTFGDSTSSTIQNASHNYSTDGLYSISLTATNALGSNLTTKTNYINVSGGFPFADFNSNVTSGVNPLSVAFYDTTLNTTTSWNWTFGAGNYSSLKNPTYTFNGISQYNVTLNVTGPGGTNKTTKVYYINSTLALTNPNSTINITPYNRELAMTQVGNVQMNIANITGYFIYANVTYNKSAIQFISATNNFSVIAGLNVSSINNAANGFVNLNVSKVDGSTIVVGNTLTPIADLTFKAISTSIPSPLNFSSPTTDYLVSGYQEGIVNQRNGRIITSVGNFTFNVIIQNALSGATITELVTLNATGANITPTFRQTSTGTTSFYSEYGNVMFNIGADAYYPSNQLVLIEGTSDIILKITPYSGGGAQNTWYSPHQVRLTVLGRTYSDNLKGYYLYVTPIVSSFPPGASTNWLTSIYGADPAAANDMMNGTLIMNGQTDEVGAVVFTVLSSIGYNVRVVNATAGIDQTVKLYPIEGFYNIWITTGDSITTTAYQNTSNTSLTYNAINTSYGSFGFYYEDTSGSTTNVTFNVTNIDNGTVVYSKLFTGIGLGHVSDSYTILLIPGERYRWSYIATDGIP